MELADRSICTGCGACKAACSKGAIYYKDDHEGFPTPFIDGTLCVECGLCNRVCPALEVPEMHPIQGAYAAQARDKDLLRKSTSGGVFPILANEIFRKNGIVYGCVWDAEYNAIFARAETEEKIAPMKGSKYVWSWAGDAFADVKKDLESGKTVLFAGMPCQVAGLKKYLRKDYQELYLLDFLCSGMPSPLAFHKYLETITTKENYSELNFKFRDKNPYGVGVHITYNGQKKKPDQRGGHFRNSYYYAFFRHVLDRRSCYKCPYGTDQRISDITVGDYWGIENYHSDMDIIDGISALLVNTEKGASLVSNVSDRMLLVPTKKENISKANNLLLGGKKRSRKVPEIREAFFESLNKDGWMHAERKYLHNADRMRMTMKLLIPRPVVRLAKELMKRGR